MKPHIGSRFGIRTNSGQEMQIVEQTRSTWWRHASLDTVESGRAAMLGLPVAASGEPWVLEPYLLCHRKVRFQ
jgi:hypothetical protein